MEGAQDTLVQDTTIEGALRPTAEILQATSGPAFEQKFIDMFHRPIAAGLMLALTEDGIRAYNNGTRCRATRRLARRRGAGRGGTSGRPASRSRD
jgi:hypothetical protein